MSKNDIQYNNSNNDSYSDIDSDFDYDNVEDDDLEP